MLDIVVLAAGKGTRMKSALPKVLHPVGGKPMLGHVLDTARTLNADYLNVVIGHGAELVEQQYQNDDVRFVLQAEQLGTGHAVQQAQQHLRNDALNLILYGDVPLIKIETLQSLIDGIDSDSMGLLTVELANPTGYGRIIRDGANQVTAIVEEKDASPEQKAITEGNTGVMAIWGKDLNRWLPQLSDNNAQKEYYLTDVIALAQAEGKRINTQVVLEEEEVLGVNDRRQQAQLERYYQQRQADMAMQDGATLLDPSRFDCRGELTLGQDVIIDVNCVIEGKVSLGDGVRIGPNCQLINTSIAAGTVVKANTVCEDAVIGEACDIGPYARVRPGTVLSKGAKLGNFVETKKAIIGEGSKVNHLTYIGDSEIGDGVNVGAGTITCNYDGVNKSKTTIKNGAFIGSNSSLVAPVTIGENATVAAGATITTDVEDGALAVARAKQRSIKSWKRPTKK
ncbi:MAG: bifunctional UDP-N-acetylglucosamine diphosphorylase/glucosamine-1-phosphate N-acetyltransferase GlmU [Candidatus Pelagadaptatus aseana]|uniref:bifunctional UDP-N-acetylglucosamine diphosphorylase/glucosamine-1-phosphate N-acetyltransferase GlmU n=1 Tax=Candidatus Pelagadaptatus aseana TaxID=3120508 RepID=UPI0039B34E2A